MERLSRYEVPRRGRGITSTRVTILLGALLVGCLVHAQPSIIYPQQEGVVSDYADKLTDAQVSELTQLILDYGRRTSIQFAVVVVNDLHGLPAGQYANQLGDLWGVGQHGRNNGVVLLWAPRERAYALRIAEGLKADMRNSDATQITRQYLLPHFKREEYYDGLKETVVETMGRLGDLSWEERIKSRAHAAQEDSKENEAARRMLLILVLMVGAPATAGVIFYKWRQRREKLTEIIQAKDAIADSLKKAEYNTPRLQQLLDDFSKEAPEQNISALRADLAQQPAHIVEIKVEATTLNFNDLKSYDEIMDTMHRAETESDLLDSMQERLNNIRNAKERSRALMEQMSKQSFSISEMRDSSRRDEVERLLSESRQYYQRARQGSSMDLVDWLIIEDMLSRSHQQVQQAVVVSQTEPYVAASESYDSADSGSASNSSSFADSGGGGFAGGSGADGTY